MFVGASGAVSWLVGVLRDESVSVTMVVTDILGADASVRIRVWLLVTDAAAHRGDSGVAAVGVRIVSALTRFNHACTQGSAVLSSAPTSWGEDEPERP